MFSKKSLIYSLLFLLIGGLGHGLFVFLIAYYFAYFYFSGLTLMLGHTLRIPSLNETIDLFFRGFNIQTGSFLWWHSVVVGLILFSMLLVFLLVVFYYNYLDTFSSLRSKPILEEAN